MAMQLGETEPGIEGNAISRWERGTHEPGPRYVRLLSLLYDRRPADLGLSDTGVKKSDQRSAATIELIQRSQASDLDPSAADTIDGAVDRLCRSYSTTPPALLLPRVQQRLWHFHRHLSSRLSIAQHQHLLRASGWLYLLLAALHNDLGEREPADSSRDAALHFGTEANDLEIQAWAFETTAYFNLGDRPREAADLAAVGRNLAPAGTHAAIAVTIQESRAWGRLRDRPRAERALLQSMKAIEKLPSVDNPQHHFVFDQAKFLHYAHTTYSWLDMPEQTERYARQAIAEFSDPAGRNHWPSRVTTARLDLALALSQRGSQDEAAATANQALAKATFMRRFQLEKAHEMLTALEGYSSAEAEELRERLALARLAFAARSRTDW